MANKINTRNKREGAGFSPTPDVKERNAEASTGAKVVLYASFITIIPIFWYISTMNSLRSQQVQINEGASGIDVQLQKRRDTLVKLFESTKGYIKHEREVLQAVTELRSSKPNAQNRERLNATMTRLAATFEAYPNLRAVEAVQKLMDESAYLEREIAAARRNYNSLVSRFNQRILVFASNVVASNMKLSSFAMFQASEEAVKDVDLKF